MKISQQHWRILFEVPADLDSVSCTRHLLQTVMQEREIEKQQAQEIGLALTEALNNVIENRHASSDRPIEIEMILQPGEIRLGIKAKTHFDASKLREALSQAALPSDTEERGRGLYLVKTLMDKVGVRDISRGRTEFWMKKKV